MTAVEFQADIKNGTIEIPIEYRSHVKGTVRVIVLSSERWQQPDMIEQLLAESLKVDHFQPLPREEIYRD
jgi:hypothetical protein